MADPELLTVVHEAYAAYSRGEIEPILELLHPDVELQPPLTSIDPQPIHGREAVREYLAPNFFEDQSAEPLEVLQDGDRLLVVARVRARGRGSGIEIDGLAYHLWTLAEGRAARFAVFVDRDQAFAAFREPN